MLCAGQTLCRQLHCMLWRPPCAGPARGACAACVMHMTYCPSGNSYRAEGRLLRAVHGQKLPGNRRPRAGRRPLLVAAGSRPARQLRSRRQGVPLTGPAGNTREMSCQGCKGSVRVAAPAAYGLQPSAALPTAQHLPADGPAQHLPADGHALAIRMHICESRDLPCVWIVTAFMQDPGLDCRSWLCGQRRCAVCPAATSGRLSGCTRRSCGASPLRWGTDCIQGLGSPHLLQLLRPAAAGRHR